MNSPPPKPEVILTNFFAEPTVLLVPITSVYPYLYNLMLTASYVCRPYYPQLIVPHTLQKYMLDVYCDILANLD